MKILLTGSGGMLGGAILRQVKAQKQDWDIFAPRSHDIDLRDQAAVNSLFKEHSFNAVIHAAARVGGIKANMEDQAGFLSDNLLINTHVIRAAHESGVKRFINFGSSCMYPRNHRQPLAEENVLAAPLEPTNEGYAIAKIAASRLCDYISRKYDMFYRSFIPCNLYGPGDYFHPQKSHLLPAVILKIHNAKISGAKEVEIWGNGTARREVLFVDDLAAFIVKAVPRLEGLPPLMNLGSDTDYSVTEIYQYAAKVLGWDGEFRYQLDAPMGMTHKLMSSAKARQYGWTPQTPLLEGIQKTYQDYLITEPRM